MIYTVTLNPALDKAYSIKVLKPGEINKITPVRQDPGGKGLNVSKVLKALGMQSTAAAALGGETGRQIASIIESSGIDTCFVYQDCETRTNLKITDMYGVTTDINARGTKFRDEDIDELKSKLLSVAKEGDILILAGSLPIGAPDDLYAQWIVEFKSLGVKVFLDASGSPLETGLTAKPYFVKPTADELEIENTFESASGAAEMLVSSGVKKVVISMGALGAVYADCDGVVIYADAIPVAPVCTTGAGDSMLAAMVYAEEKGMDPLQAMSFATAVAAAEVMTEGTAAPDYDVIKSLLPQSKVRRVE